MSSWGKSSSKFITETECREMKMWIASFIWTTIEALLVSDDLLNGYSVWRTEGKATRYTEIYSELKSHKVRSFSVFSTQKQMQKTVMEGWREIHLKKKICFSLPFCSALKQTGCEKKWELRWLDYDQTCHRILCLTQICNFSGTEDRSCLRNRVENTLAAGKVQIQWGVQQECSYALFSYCFH